MHPMLNIAIRAAHAAGDHIVKYVDRVQDISINNKGRNDFVSEVDRQAEAIVVDTLLKSYPRHSILAEEGGEINNDPEYQWVIDPLDGTTNFLHGFPQFAVSIALKFRGQLDQAVIYDPMRQELFSASKGAGAYMDRKRIRVSRQNTLDGALLGTGFPFRDHDRLERFIESFRLFFPKSAGIRRAGAASLDLAYVACGRLDGFWEFGLNEWDVAAGKLLIIEAGGNVGPIPVTEIQDQYVNIVAGNVKIYEAMLELLNPGS